MSELEAFAGITNSPALMVLDAPKIFARLTNASADLIAPLFSSCRAADIILDPGFIMTVVSRSSGPVVVQPWMKFPAMTASSNAATTTAHLAMRRFACFPYRFATINPFHSRRRFAPVQG